MNELTRRYKELCKESAFTRSLIATWLTDIDLSLPPGPATKNPYPKRTLLFFTVQYIPCANHNSALPDYYSLSFIERNTGASVCFIHEPRKAALPVIYLNALF